MTEIDATTPPTTPTNRKPSRGKPKSKAPVTRKPREKQSVVIQQRIPAGTRGFDVTAFNGPVTAIDADWADISGVGGAGLQPFPSVGEALKFMREKALVGTFRIIAVKRILTTTEVVKRTIQFAPDAPAQA